MIVKILEILRILAVGAAFYFGYPAGYENGYHPEIRLHLMVPVIVVAIAGFSGIEGLFFGRQAAQAKGFETGSNYQRQSAIALLSFAFAAMLVFFMIWGIRAELTVLFAFLFFFIFFICKSCRGCRRAKQLQMGQHQPAFSHIADDRRAGLSGC